MNFIEPVLFFSSINARNVLLGIVLLSISSSIVGTFAFLKKQTLACDAVAHAVLPGICLAFFIVGKKHEFWLTIGACLTSWLAFVVIGYIVHHSKIQQSTAIALVSSFSFGLGSFLLSILQHSSLPGQEGLKSFLLGSASILLKDDFTLLLCLSLVVTIMLCLLFKHLVIIAFDPLFAKSIGIPVKSLDVLFMSLMSLSIVIGIRTVGILLVSAMLITPVVTARFWISKISYIILFTILMSSLSCFWGILISLAYPYMPTGPWIVIIMSLIAYFSFLLFWAVRFTLTRS